MQNVDLNKFPGIPDFARDSLQNNFAQHAAGADGVTQFMGHDKGVAYRFFPHAEYNFMKSKAAKYEAFDDIDMIQWYNDEFNQPTEQVRRLPEHLLAFDEETGEILGGQYAEAFRAYKQGRQAPGTKLRHWGLLTESQVATLETAKIFSVEQLAAKEEKTFKAKYGKDFGEVYDRAREFTAAKENRFEVDKLADENVAQQKLIADLQMRLAALEEKSIESESEEVSSEPTAEKRRPGRPRKVE